MSQSPSQPFPQPRRFELWFASHVPRFEHAAPGYWKQCDSDQASLIAQRVAIWTWRNWDWLSPLPDEDLAKITYAVFRRATSNIRRNFYYSRRLFSAHLEFELGHGGKAEDWRMLCPAYDMDLWCDVWKVIRRMPLRYREALWRAALGESPTEIGRRWTSVHACELGCYYLREARKMLRVRLKGYCLKPPRGRTKKATSG